MPAVVYSRFEREILKLYEPPHRRLATWYKMRRVLTEFGALPKVRRTTDITPSAILTWVGANEHRAPMTNRSYLSCFRAAVNIAKKLRWLSVSPWEIRNDWITFDVDEDDEAPARHLSMDEIVAILDQVDAEALTGGWVQARLQALVYTYTFTGLRKMEALGLKVSDLLPGGGVIQVRSRRKRRLKTRKSARLVGIPEEMSVILARWLSRVDSEWLFPGLRKTKPWFHGSPGKKPLDQVKAVALRAGVEHVTIQCMRRSIATHAKRLGIEPAEVQALLGHANIRTQDWYVEQDASNARDVARRIRFRTSSPPPSPGPLLFQN